MHLRKAERITHHHPASGTNFKHSSHGRPYLTLCVTIALGPAVVTFTIIDRCGIFPQQLQHNQEWRPRGAHRRTFPCSQQCPACIQTASSISLRRAHGGLVRIPRAAGLIGDRQFIAFVIPTSRRNLFCQEAPISDPELAAHCE